MIFSTRKARADYLWVPAGKPAAGCYALTGRGSAAARATPPRTASPPGPYALPRVALATASGRIATLAHTAVLLCLLLSPLARGRAQGLVFEHYGIREGLNNRLVRDIEFDDTGLVWLATANGLHRFDGYEFVDVSASAGLAKPSGLSMTNVHALAPFEDGRMAVFYEDLYSAFELIDPANFQVEKVEVATKVEGQPRGFFVSPTGQVYVVAKGDHFTEVSLYDRATRRFQSIVRLQERWGRQYPSIDLLVTKAGDVFLYDKEHALRWVAKGGNPSRVSNTFLPPSAGVPASMPILYQDHRARVWMSFQGHPGVYRFDADSGSVQRYDKLDPQLTYTQIWEDAADNLIFNQAEPNGIYPISRQLLCLSSNGSILNFSHLLEVSEFILHVRSRDFFRTLLIGTDTGLKVAQNTTTRVERYLAKRLGEDRRGFSMRGMCADASGKRLFFSREVSRWYALDVETHVMDTIRLNDKHGDFLDFNNCQGIWYSGGYVYGVTGDGTDRRHGYLHRYDPDNCTNRIFEYPLEFTAYAKANDSLFWVAGRTENNQGDLLTFNPATEQFVPFRDAKGRNPFATLFIRYILPDAQRGTLWVGTENGLVAIDTHKKTWRHYLKPTGTLPADATPAHLSDNAIYALFQADDGRLWIGTLNGLTAYRPELGEWTVYTTTDGLPSSTVAAILPAADGELWVSTYNGLSYFQPDKKQSRNFFQIDGLSHNEFNRFSAMHGPDGRYYFGGVNGINAFREDELLVSRSIPKVLLASFSYQTTKADSIVRRLDLLTDSPEIVIEPHQSYFSFDFTLPIYTPMADNQFRYRLGNDPSKAWIYLKGDRSLRYTNMRAGCYEIHVQGADANGNWGSDPLVIKLLVKEVIWRRWWFLLLVAVVVVGFAYGALRYHLEEKLRMERLRTQLASDLHDEVSGLLAGISMQSELLRSKVDEDPVLDEKLQHIRQASQRAMSKISDVIWSIDARRDNIGQLLSRMEEHADEVLLPLDVQYKIKLVGLEREKPIPANVRQDVYFIYKEAVNNAAKHARATLVNITLEQTQQHFTLTVQDNGIGNTALAAPNEARGQGLSNMYMRAQRLSATLGMHNANGFTVQLRMRAFQ